MTPRGAPAHIDANAWTESNQGYLMATVGLVKLTLQRHLAKESDPAEWHEREVAARALVAETEAALSAPSALHAIDSVFGLTTFERDVLLMCAGVELDSSLLDLWTRSGGPGSFPTFGLALSALPDAHWSAVTPAAPLRHWRLIEVAAGSGLMSGQLRIDERILHYLAGIGQVDERLDGLLDTVSVAGQLPRSHARIADAIARIWRGRAVEIPVVQLCGLDRLAKAAIAAAACRSVGAQLLRVRSDSLPGAAADHDILVRLCQREAALTDAVLLVDADRIGAGDSAQITSVARLIDRFHGTVIVIARDPIPDIDRPSVRLDVRKPEPSEQREMWLSSLGPGAADTSGDVARVVAQFDLGPRAIQTAMVMAQADGNGTPTQDLAPRLWDACRAQARPGLNDLAQRIEPAAAWSDLILPEAETRMLGEIVAHARRRSLVYGDWGFATKGNRGLGISVLFSGPSGTGKTMAAEVLAGELRLDLYRIDLSSVVSKYIGETEKNLRRVFDAAEDGGAILLFDEADALFGKRSEVKDSHDRYANIEVSYLLQRMEAYRGLAILTTNFKSAIDQAFLRRLRFVVQFPFPDAFARSEIWRRIFPAETPLEDVDPVSLARLNVTGGSIRNIALGAAFLAADAREPIRMTHLLRAARGEYAKLERPLTEAELGGLR